MKLGATPKHTFTLPFDPKTLKEAKITYTQDNRVILEKYLSDCTIEGNNLIVTLTQEDTFLFVAQSIIEIQARVLTLGGEASTSDVHTIRAERCLDREVLQ